MPTLLIICFFAGPLAQSLAEEILYIKSADIIYSVDPIFMRVNRHGTFYMPQMRAILTNPKQHEVLLAATYGTVTGAPGDWSPLQPLARRHLQHQHSLVREAAATYLSKYGTTADVGRLLAIVSGHKRDKSGYAAALALGGIGDTDTADALDLWLQFARQPDDKITDEGVAWAVARSRDRIKARLAAKKANP